MRKIERQIMQFLRDNHVEVLERVDAVHTLLKLRGPSGKEGPFTLCRSACEARLTNLKAKIRRDFL